MELFDKIYNCYYRIIRHMLDAAANRPISGQDMEDICRIYGFRESALSILPKIKDSTWALFQETASRTYRSRLHGPLPVLPLTLLQKAWLRSLLSDPRLGLFLSDGELNELERCMEGTSPLYEGGDFCYYDQYKDGDPYDSPEYRAHFHTILTAIREHRSLLVTYEGKKGRNHALQIIPYQFQYSSKNDKFRLCCLKYSHGRLSQGILLNLARIRGCRLSPDPDPTAMDLNEYLFKPVQKAAQPVLLEISGERNSLERCMLHFANYEKHTEYDEARKCWLCSIYYDLADETELLIEILSFGPVVRVLGPDDFVRQIRRRVKRQHDLFYSVAEDTKSRT